MRGSHPHESFVALAAALFLLAHVWAARAELGDIDSINFALGVQSYDVARHQPHPPGYPVYIAGVRAVAGLVHAVRPAERAPEALGLVLLAGAAGAAAVLASHRLFAAVGCSPWAATTGALLFGAAPLVWLTAARPLSDMPGLAAALIVQVLLLRAKTAPLETVRVHAGVAGLLTGLAIGIRSQVLWLTLPLAALVVVSYLRARLVRPALLLAAGVLAGMVAWGVPMLIDTGGLTPYLSALDDQADDDFEGVPMLAMEPSVARLGTALGDTLVQPWAVGALAAVMLALGAAGAALVATRATGMLGMLLCLWAPYAAFHLLFQETVTTRYALPLVVPACVLAAVTLDVGIGRWSRRAATLVAVVLGCVLLGVSLQAHVQYATVPGSVFDALRALRAAADARPPAQVLMHRRVWAETRRAREVLPLPGGDVVPPPRAREWISASSLVGQPGGYAWWLVDPTRGDLPAIDAKALALQMRHGWPMPAAALLGGTRPHPFDWYAIDEPSWVLGDGWALTPELAGLSHAAGAGPTSPGGAQATVREGDTPRTLLIGGRHIAPASGPVRLRVRVGDYWDVSDTIEPGAFHRVWTVPPVPDGQRPGSTSLAVHVDGAALPPSGVVLEQFDIQPQGVPVAALGDGWYEPERDIVTGRRWRWMSSRAVIDIWGATCDVRLTLIGTWPRHYDESPVLTLRTASGDTLREVSLSRPFSVTVDVPPSAQVDGRVSVELLGSNAFVAGAATGTSDARRLALEVADVSVVPASGARTCAAGR